MSTGSAIGWGRYAGQYTYDVKWNGVPLTVECEDELSDGAVVPVRVLAGQIDITEIIDTNHGHLCQLVQDAHDNRYCVEPVWARKETA